MSDPAGGDESAPDGTEGDGDAPADAVGSDAAVDAEGPSDGDDAASVDAGIGPSSGDDSPLAALRDRVDDPARAAVLLIVVGSLLLRTVQLGQRIFHWDEGRVGYWILRFDATGEFFYRPIIHGPFLPVVNNALFDLIGASDFAARLPVALVGGLLPLVALLLRHRLRDREVVALALVLSVDPLLVYYGRFMRGDVLVGSFAVAAFALVVYAIDTRRTLPLFGSAALLALGFTAKENALVYLACFLGAGVLLLDHRLVRTARRTGSPLDALVAEAVALGRFLEEWTAGSRTRRWIERRVRERDPDAHWGWEAGFLGHLAVWGPLGAVGVVATFLGVVAFFYAPRPDLWQALGVASASAGTAGVDAAAPTLGSVLHDATWGAGEKFWGTWASGDHSGHPYVPYLWDILETLAYGSGVLVVLAVVGFLADGYGEARGTRSLVAYATYWGAASLVGYPVATDIQAPWAAIHIVLPLAIPAAVGLASVADSVRGAVASGDAVTAALAGLVVLAAVGGVAAPNADYWNSASEEDKQVLQWAQPENAYKEALQDAGAVARNNDEGADVLWVGTSTGRGTRLYVSDESSVDRMPPGGPSWHSRLPTPWYLELHDANVTSTPPEARYEGLPPAEEMPPVVIAKPNDAEELESRLDGYESREYAFRLWSERIVVFIDEEALADARE
ncbi:flippase activity-associated protein Agl23 [Halobaculum rubrum]|uniref:flippase activity-associated protein Agl23 n=1 Tax=Halobaculum rubrum TaxID=2872158 RepID=UPI001CA419E6|nr:flippase activity-associated protein Agl23 [Halobaculum rubrum]QZX98589.1 TIGR03663 family protein [Halobaculum rubrum]